jgi:hypothetical protein
MTQATCDRGQLTKRDTEPMGPRFGILAQQRTERSLLADSIIKSAFGIK